MEQAKIYTTMETVKENDREALEKFTQSVQKLPPPQMVMSFNSGQNLLLPPSSTFKFSSQFVTSGDNGSNSNHNNFGNSNRSPNSRWMNVAMVENGQSPHGEIHVKNGSCLEQEKSTEIDKIPHNLATSCDASQNFCFLPPPNGVLDLPQFVASGIDSGSNSNIYNFGNSNRSPNSGWVNVMIENGLSPREETHVKNVSSSSQEKSTENLPRQTCTSYLSEAYGHTQFSQPEVSGNQESSTSVQNRDKFNSSLEVSKKTSQRLFLPSSTSVGCNNIEKDEVTTIDKLPHNLVSSCDTSQFWFLPPPNGVLAHSQFVTSGFDNGSNSNHNNFGYSNRSPNSRCMNVAMVENGQSPHGESHVKNGSCLEQEKSTEIDKPPHNLVTSYDASQNLWFLPPPNRVSDHPQFVTSSIDNVSNSNIYNYGNPSRSPNSGWVNVIMIENGPSPRGENHVENGLSSEQEKSAEINEIPRNLVTSCDNRQNLWLLPPPNDVLDHPQFVTSNFENGSNSEGISSYQANYEKTTYSNQKDHETSSYYRNSWGCLNAESSSLGQDNEVDYSQNIPESAQDEEVIFSFDVDDEVPEIDVPYEVCNVLSSILGLTDANDMNIDDPTGIKSLNITNKVQVGSCDNRKMFVQTSDHAQKEKKLCCPYCRKSQTKLARHMEMVHKTEEEVKKFHDLPKGSYERRIILDSLRKKGTLIWNTNADLNNGQLITSRRPHQHLCKTAADYMACANCFGTYSINNLRHHYNKCLTIYVKGEHLSMKLGRAVEGRIDANANKRLRLVFPVLRNDEVVQIIRYDWLIIVHGNRLCVKYTSHFQDNLIRARLRLAGRILLALRVINPQATDFASIYQPKMYDSVIEAVRKVGRLNENLNIFEAPATASSAVTLLRKIGFSIKFELIKKEDDVNLSKAEKFLTLLEDASTSILKTVADSEAKKRREKKEIIPTDADVKKLTCYLERERRQCLKDLSKRYSFANFFKLSEIVMISIIVFNRRRTGETQNILMTDFNGRESINENSNAQLYSELSEHERELVQRYSRMTIRGKLGRPVPVLLEPEISTCIELLIQHRSKARISIHNEYLFALPTSNELQTKVVNACVAMERFASSCGADNPESLRGTTLRKHIASKCISMDLNDNEMSDFAIFLGHHLKIHREYYRINGIQRDIVKMGELLEAVQGKIVDSKQKNDDIGSKSDAVTEVGGMSVTKVTSQRQCGNTEVKESTSVVNVEAESDDCDSNFEIPTKTQKAQKIRKRKYSSSDDDGDVDEAKHGKKVKFPKKRWSEQEITAVRAAFSKYFATKTLPSTQEILKQQKSNEPLQKRTWQQVKTYISNQNKV